jgi:hypothetical protein
MIQHDPLPSHRYWSHAMIKSLLYITPAALIGLMATEATAAPAAWGGGMARDIAAVTAESTEARVILVRRGGGGGRGGGGRGGA